MSKLTKISVVLVVFTSTSTPVLAVESIKVLVVRGPGVTTAAALNYLLELNLLMENSGLGEYEFENAGDHLGYTDLYEPSVCASNNPQALLACLALDQWENRNLYDADIVLLVTPIISATNCGAVVEGGINRPSIGPENALYGWAAIGITCIYNVPIASHEVLHLLNIEHRFGDPELDDPVRFNHAYATSAGQATAGAEPGDCVVGGECSNWINEMSDPTDNFPNSTAPQGHSVSSDAKKVVRDLSWDAVAAYRPVPGGAEAPDPPACWIFEKPCLPGDSSPELDFSWAPATTGGVVEKFDVQRKIGLGDWGAVVSDVLSECLGWPSLPGIVNRFRVIAHGPGGVQQCEASITVNMCGPPGSGGGGRR